MTDIMDEYDKMASKQQSAFTQQQNFVGNTTPDPANDPFVQAVKAGNFSNITGGAVSGGAKPKGHNINDVYNALAYAETGTHPQAKNNPWVRTHLQGSNSSAYGPVQMTGGEGSMMMNVYNDPDLAKRMGINEDEIGYMQRYLEQADKFLDPVSDEAGSTYGYGGSGDLTSPEDMSNYENIAKKIMKYELNANERAGGDINKFVKNWRGDDADTDYFNKFNSQMNP